VPASVNDSSAAAASGHSACSPKIGTALAKCVVASDVGCSEPVCRVATNAVMKPHADPPRQTTYAGPLPKVPLVCEKAPLRMEADKTMTIALPTNFVDPPDKPREAVKAMTTTVKRVPESAADARIIIRCEMPLTMDKSCYDCVYSGPLINCVRHMRTCDAADIFIGCENCPRFLCGAHMLNCYCKRVFAKPSPIKQVQRKPLNAAELVDHQTSLKI
jgi:hypothetical protein